VVDVFYDRLVLGVKKGTGRICVRRNGSNDTSSTAIPDGQITILSLVVQPDGSYKVWANGAQVMTGAATGTDSFISLVNGVAGGFANYINVGRNNPDGWTTFNGNIGDVFVYKVALTDVPVTGERQLLEADLTAKFLTTDWIITSSAGANGYINPTGSVPVNPGGSQIFTITPNIGYKVATVLVDGVNNPGAVTSGSYTFTNVTAAHTILATFSVATYTINASAGTGGSITPSGTITKNYGTSQAFAIAANPGYAVANVTVDGVPQGPITGYTFSNITANHTISAAFAKPVGMNNKSVLTDAKAQGRAVVVWGKVKSIIDLPTSFTINDGYSSDVTVNVNGVALPVGFDTTKTAIVTGIVSADKKVQAQTIRAVP